MILILFCGCATAHKITRVNLGMTKNEVIKVLGMPVDAKAKVNTEYLYYQFSETGFDALRNNYTPYFVKLVNGKVDAFGRKEGLIKKFRDAISEINPFESITIKRKRQKTDSENKSFLIEEH